MQGVLTLLASLGLPPWALPAAIIALVVFFGPKLVQSIESDKGRRVVKRHALTQGAERGALADEVLRIAGDDPAALVGVADEALAQGDRTLAKRAVARLQELDARAADVARLTDALEGAGPLPPTAMEAAIIVERFLESGMHAGARDKLARFLRRWPQDPELLALQARLDEPGPDASA